MQKWMCGGALALCVLVADLASGDLSEGAGVVEEGVEVGRTQPEPGHVELPEEGIILIHEGDDVYARPMRLPLPKNPLLPPPQPMAQRR